ncbi:MAG TPA: DUF4397 domain-containing protein [Trueperaceae bacterium]
MRAFARVFQLWLLLACAWGAAQPMAAIRLTHLSPDAPQFDMVVDRQLFMIDVTYGEVSPYQPIPAGQHEISVWPHRLPDGAAGEEAEGPQTLEPITIIVDLEDGGYYTLAISGFYQAAPETSSGTLAVEVEPAEATVLVTGPRGFERTFQGDRVLEELEAGRYAVRAEYQGYQPATFEISVQQNETSTVSITLQEGEEEGDATATLPENVPAAPSGSWRPVELHAFRDDLEVVPPPGGSRVRLVHLSPLTGPVDLLAIPSDGAGEPAVMASGLEFPNAGDYMRLPGRDYTFQVRLAGADAIVTQVRDVTVPAGGVYTFFLVQEPADNYVRLVPSVDALLPVRR